MPLALCCFPSGGGKEIVPALVLSDRVIQVTAAKLGEQKKWLILRLFEPTGKRRETRVSIPSLSLDFDVSLDSFELKSLAVELETKDVFEVDLMERKLREQGLLFKSERG
jgi:alpha-mannosidase